MFNVGDTVTVFKSRDFDVYHKDGIWKKGVVLKKYPNFYLILIEDVYRECFFESEVFLRNDKDTGSEQ